MRRARVKIAVQDGTRLMTLLMDERKYRPGRSSSRPLMLRGQSNDNNCIHLGMDRVHWVDENGYL